jgi:hypothetical protein
MLMCNSSSFGKLRDASAYAPKHAGTPLTRIILPPREYLRSMEYTCAILASLCFGGSICMDAHSVQRHSDCCRVTMPAHNSAQYTRA